MTPNRNLDDSSVVAICALDHLCSEERDPRGPVASVYLAVYLGGVNQIIHLNWKLRGKLPDPSFLNPNAKAALIAARTAENADPVDVAIAEIERLESLSINPIST